MASLDVITFLSLFFLALEVARGDYFKRELPSVKGVCDAQCEALCQDHVNGCESKCSPRRPRKWIINCENGGNCTGPGYCSVLKNESLPTLPDFYIPPKPDIHIIRDSHTKSIMLRWKGDKTPTNMTIIYIVQWNKSNTTVHDDTLWFTLGWTKWGWYFVEEEPDPCKRPWFRVAAVSRYGSLWYTDPTPTPVLDVARYPPGKVRNIYYTDVYYNNVTEEVNFNLYWTEPEHWDTSDISGYSWTHHLHQPCLDSFISGGPVGVPVFYDSVSSGDVSKVHVRMPKIAIGCKFKFQVSAFSKCKHDTPGKLSSIDITIDCHRVRGYKCDPVPYNPPGNVKNITLFFLPNGSLMVKWSPPFDMGSEHSIQFYHIRWGTLDFSDKLLGIATLYNTTTKIVDGNTTCIVIPVPDYSPDQTDRYGVQIIATPPRHSLVQSWISPVNQMTSDEADLQTNWPQKPGYTPILRDDNGVVIVVVPKVKGVRVYVTLPEQRSNVGVIGFYVYWGGLNNISNKPSLINRRNIFIDKDAFSVDLEDLVEKETYGVQVITSYEQDDLNFNYNVTNNNDDDTQLHTFTMPEIQEIPDYKHPKDITVTAVVVAMTGVVVTVLIVLFVYTKKRRKKLSYLERQIGRDNDGFTNYYDLGARGRQNFNDITTPPVVADSWELPHSCLKLGQVLGTGAFGLVVRGQVSQALLRHRGVQVTGRQDTLLVPVAVKMLQEGVDGRYYRDFLKEIQLMKDIGYHVNVVSMLGCCTLRDPLCLVVEHMALGDLLHYLKKIRHMLHSHEDSTGHYQNREVEHLTPLDLLNYARQIVRGMEFLSAKSFVHRDLAARNILVDENKVLKIGDFGLTRYIYDDKIYVNRRGGKLPIKWMSPEAIFDLTFSTASDVWSYGIVLFELMTLGGTPYPGIANRELLTELRNGYCMEQPDNCSREMYQLMKDCWKTDPKWRPSFTELGERIDSMISECSGREYLDLQLDETHGYYQDEESEDDDFEVGLDTVRGSEETSLEVEIQEGQSYAISHAGIWSEEIVEELLGKAGSSSMDTRKKGRLDKGDSLSIRGSTDTRKKGRLDNGDSKTIRGSVRSQNHTVSTIEDNLPSIITVTGSTGLSCDHERSERPSIKGYHVDEADTRLRVVLKPILKVSGGEGESDSSCGQLEGSDDVFGEPLYTTPYSYLETPSNMTHLQGEDTSPTDSELSDGFFRSDSLTVSYHGKHFRSQRVTSEISTTSIDSGLPQSPTQQDFPGSSPRGSPDYLPKYTKKTPSGRSKLRRLTRNSSLPPLSIVANSDADINSSSV